ncbi:MAG: hypothetical protein KAI64_03580 [Thermoplasmata archaeon]|nr:hypothetical protein [Thermoplasmata archaeon]
MAYLLEGAIAGIVIFFALMGVFILFIEGLDLKISLGFIFVLIAVAIGFFFFGGIWNVGGCIAIGVILALIGNHIVENMSMV